jgi:hypothetical protein
MFFDQSILLYQQTNTRTQKYCFLAFALRELTGSGNSVSPLLGIFGPPFYVSSEPLTTHDPLGGSSAREADDFVAHASIERL